MNDTTIKIRITSKEKARLKKIASDRKISLSRLIKGVLVKSPFDV